MTYIVLQIKGKNKDLPSHGIIPFWPLLVPLGPTNAFRDVERVQITCGLLLQITCGFLSIFLKHLILIFQVNRTENNLHNRKVHKKLHRRQL